MTGRGLLGVGERIELRRRQRGLSRRVLAELVGRSEEWLRQVETGRHKLDSITTLVLLADALQVDDLTDFIAGPARVPQAARPVEAHLGALRLAIIDHPAIRAFDPDGAPGGTPAGQLRLAVQDCWNTWSNSPQRYTLLFNAMPAHIRAARANRWLDPTAEADGLLVDVYHIARHLLTRVGDHQQARMVADRALNIVNDSGQTPLIAACAWHTTTAMLFMGHFSECRRFGEAAARQLSADPPEKAEDLQIWGALHLIAAEGAAGQGETFESERLAAAAASAAAEVGDDWQSQRICFGPIEVGISHIHRALRLGRVAEAVRRAGEIDVPDGYPVDRQARYYVASSYAFARRGDDAGAVFALLKAEQACPEDIRYDQRAHRIIQLLIRRGNRLVHADVRRLAEVAGLT